MRGQPAHGARHQPGDGQRVGRPGVAGEGDQRLVVGAEVHPVGQRHLELHPAPGVVHQRVQRLREEPLVVLAPGRRGVVGALRPQRPAAEQHPDVDPHQHDRQARGAEQPGPPVDDDHERPGHDHRHHQPGHDHPDERPEHVQHPTHHQRRWGDAAGAHGRQRRPGCGARLGTSAGPARGEQDEASMSAAQPPWATAYGPGVPLHLDHDDSTLLDRLERSVRAAPRPGRPWTSSAPPPPTPGSPTGSRGWPRGCARLGVGPGDSVALVHAELPAERHRLLRGAAPRRHRRRAQPALHRGRAAPAVHRPRGPGRRRVGQGRAGRRAAARGLVARARRRGRPHRRAALWASASPCGCRSPRRGPPARS